QRDRIGGLNAIAGTQPCACSVPGGSGLVQYVRAGFERVSAKRSSRAAEVGWAAGGRDRECARWGLRVVAEALEDRFDQCQARWNVIVRDLAVCRLTEFQCDLNPALCTARAGPCASLIAAWSGAFAQRICSCAELIIACYAARPGNRGGAAVGAQCP